MENTPEKKRWSVEAMKDGKRFSINVREVENGYITRITEEENGPGEWEYNEKEYISKSNPLGGSSVLKGALEKEEALKIKSAVESLKILL